MLGLVSPGAPGLFLQTLFSGLRKSNGYPEHPIHVSHIEGSDATSATPQCTSRFGVTSLSLSNSRCRRHRSWSAQNRLGQALA